jgi:hypothetical protein
MTNKDIAERGQKVVMNTYGRFPIAPVKGKGSYLWDADGKQYLDFIAGIAVCALGHCHDELQKVIQQQAASLWHISNLYWIEPQVRLAEKLTQISGLEQGLFLQPRRGSQRRCHQTGPQIFLSAKGAGPKSDHCIQRFVSWQDPGYPDRHRTKKIPGGLCPAAGRIFIC